MSKDVFIVHGHDDAMKTAVDSVLRSQGLNPIILHLQPNGGKTIIEKFEHNTQSIGFAVVLLTADDLGQSIKEGISRKRARQNVILELGYFVGKIGRSKVLPLYEDGLEYPSDFAGVVYTPIDTHGAWKFKLLQELEKAGYSVDRSKVKI